MLWIVEGNCPNYFIPSENMFDGTLSCQVRAVIKSDDLGQNLARACLPRLQLTGNVQTEDNHEVKRRLKIAQIEIFEHTQSEKLHTV